MSQTITLIVPDETFALITKMAEQTNRPLEEVLVQSVIEKDRNLAESLNLMPDAVIIRLADMQSSREENEELSDLLYDNQAGLIDAEKQLRLNEMLANAQNANLIKAHALVVAVQRGLRPRGPYEPKRVE